MKAWIVVALGLLAALRSAPAHADWTVCNQTSFIIEAATGFAEGERSVTEGWTRLRPGECRVARSGELTPGDYFLYAKSSRAHRGGQREWSGLDELCVDVTDFSIAGETSCEAVGFQSRRFVRIEIPFEKWRTVLREPQSPDPDDRFSTPQKAEVAGLQRLLQDAGYYVKGQIDGRAGPGTDREVTRFLSDVGVARRPDTAALVDLLEKHANERADVAGLKLCNRTKHQVWTAIALRRGEEWESRGWWPLAEDECAKVIDDPLSDTGPATYVYAGLRTEDGEAPLATASETFCVAETRFSILDRQDCEAKGFESVRFAAVLAKGKQGVTLEFTESDFDPRAAGGMKR